MTKQVCELTDDQVDAVSGGAISCSDAINRAEIYIAIGDVLNAFGASAAASACYGRAQGVLEGGCGK